MRVAPLPSVVCLAFWVGAAASPAVAAEVVTVSDRFTTSSLATEQGAGEPVLSAAGRAVPLDQVVSVRWAPAAGQGGPVKVQLLDGGALTGDIAGGGEGALLLNSPVLGRLSIPLDHMSAVLFTERYPENIDPYRYEGRVLESRPPDDVVHFRSGSLTEGFIEFLGESSLRIEAEALGQLEIPYRDLSAVRFTPEAADAPAVYEGLHALVSLSDGSLIKGDGLRLTREGLELHSPVLGDIKVASGSLVQLVLLGGRSAYLSDADPAAVESTSGLVQLVDPYVRKDRAWSWGPLVMDGAWYSKGLGVHSRCVLAYDLDPAADGRFQARVGLDDTARGQSEARPQVVFRVLLDGRTVFDSGAVGADSPVTDVDVPLEGARRMELVCDFGDNFDVLGRGVWGMARVVKK